LYGGVFVEMDGKYFVSIACEVLSEYGNFQIHHGDLFGINRSPQRFRFEPDRPCLQKKIS